MADGVTVWATIGAVPGALSLVGWAVSYGKLSQQVRDMKEEISKVDSLKIQVARVEEKATSTKETVDDIKRSMDRLIERTYPERRIGPSHSA